MASSSVPSFTFQANGEDNPRQVSGSGSSCRHLSDSESEICPTTKSLARLCSRDKDERAAALEKLSQKILECLELDRAGSARLSKETLLHLLRLSRSCPLQEVRIRATELLCIAQVMLGCSKAFFFCASYCNNREPGARWCSYYANKNCI